LNDVNKHSTRDTLRRVRHLRPKVRNSRNRSRRVYCYRIMFETSGAGITSAEIGKKLIEADLVNQLPSTFARQISEVLLLILLTALRQLNRLSLCFVHEVCGIFAGSVV